MSGFTHDRRAASPPTSPRCRSSIQVWRQLTRWLGGIGVVALALAVLPRLRVGGRQLLESRAAGPEIDTLSRRIRDTVRRFGILYVGLTAAASSRSLLARLARRRRA